MATYYVKHTCGHEVKHILTAREEKAGKLEWLQGTLCPECYKAQQQAERERKHLEAIAATADLPALEGTEKQVKWATDIRAALKSQYEALEKEYGPAPEVIKQYMTDVFSRTEAKYFIDTWRAATCRGFDLMKALNEDEDDELGDAAFEWEWK